MTIAYWCILIAAFLPYFFIGIAKSKKNYLKSNSAPRKYLETIDGFRQRAHWASQNSMEAFPFFAAAIIVGQNVGKIPQETLNYLAIGFIVIRLIYGAMYLANLASLRSMVWSFGILINVAIFFMSA